MGNIIDYEYLLYRIQTDNDELDIFYLFFGITRQILWKISPELKDYMLEE